MKLTLGLLLRLADEPLADLRSESLERVFSYVLGKLVVELRQLDPLDCSDTGCEDGIPALQLCVSVVRRKLNVQVEFLP